MTQDTDKKLIARLNAHSGNVPKGEMRDDLRFAADRLTSLTTPKEGEVVARVAKAIEIADAEAEADAVRSDGVIGDWSEHCARAAISAMHPQERENPSAAIFDHKWLDPVCVESGCRSLVLERALAAYRTAQRRMLERWSEVSPEKQQELWQALHACEAAADNALEHAKGPVAPPPPVETLGREARVLARLSAAMLALRKKIHPLAQQGEDRVWRPAEQACDIIDNCENDLAILALPDTRVAGLVEALTPFVELLENFVSEDEDDYDSYRPAAFERQRHITVGHLRRARTALAAMGEGE